MENFEILIRDADSSVTVKQDTEEKQDTTPTSPGNDNVIGIEAELDLD